MSPPFEYHQLLDRIHGFDVAKLTVVFDALSEPNRCLIFQILLGGGQIGVGDLARIVEISDPLASQHLRTLREAGLILRSKEGKRVYYRINHGNPLVEALQKVVES